MIFHLHKKEKRSAKVFMRAMSEINGAEGCKPHYIVTPLSTRNIIEIVDGKTGVKKDITDYDR
jgi:hypothetical protein